MVKVLVVELGPSRDTVLHMLVIVVSLSVLSFYLTSFTSAHAPSPGILVVDNTVVERRGARTIGEISVNRSFRDSEMAKMIGVPINTYTLTGSNEILSRLITPASDSRNTSELSPLQTSTTISWINPNGGNWNTAANWRDGTGVNRVPTSSDNVFIDLAGTYTVTLNVNATVSSLTLGGAGGTQTFNTSTTLTLDGASAISPNGVLNFSAGTINGTGDLNVSGTLNWTGGTMGGSGVTNVAAGATFTLAGNQPRLERVLNNSTMAVFTSSSSFFINNGTFNNQPGAIFDARVDSSIFQSNPGTFNNSGTFRKSAGTGTTTLTLTFNNTGTVEVQTGTLTFNDGGTSSGALTAAAGTTVRLSDTRTFAASSSISAPAATVTFSGNTTIAGSYDVGTTNISGTATFNITAVTFRTLNFSSGTLGGTAIVNIPATGTLNWTGGLMGGTGVTNVAAGATFSLAGNQPRLERVLNNSTTAVFTSTSSFFINNGTFNNQAAAIFDARVDSSIFQSNPGTFNNSGTFRKSASTGTLTLNLTFNNTGTVEVQTGTLTFNDGGTSSGAVTAAAGATVILSDTRTFAASSSISAPAATVTFSGNTTIAGSYDVGTTNIASTATFNITAVTFRTLNVSSGTLGGTAIVNIPATGTLNWTGGLMGGTGLTNVAAGATFSLAGSQPRLERVLNNSTTAVFTSTSSFFINNGTFNNQPGAIFDARVDSDIFQSNPGTFNNSGMFRKSAGTGTTTLTLTFNNTGTVEVQTGTLSFNTSFIQTAGSAILNGGNIANSVLLDIQGGELRGAGTVTGNVRSAGTVRPGLSPGVLNITGNYMQTASGILEVEIGGATAGTQFDLLNVSGSATLNGTLNTVLINSFNPNNGDAFQVLNYGSRSGAFSAVNGQFDANYSATNLTLVRNATGALSITGRVLDGSANGISGVTVTISGSLGAATTTDSNGNYAFANVAAGGNYIVTPSSSNHSFSPASQTFNNLNVNRIANFVGTQTRVSISGKVSDAANAGINNVTLVLTKNGSPDPSAQTNALGNYSFTNLEAGANYVVTPAGSFTPSSQSFSNLTVNVIADFRATPTIPPQCNTVSFAAATNFAAGSLSRSVATGDFNNDGKLDLAVANAGSGNVSILLGSGTGSFSAATNFAVASQPVSVAIGDFNGDGENDLATANFNSANVSVLLGSGTGSFSAATNFAAGSAPVSVAIGDFNGDGNRDLATANFNSANVSVLLGTGTGSFGAATNFATGLGPFSVAIGDFNGDGRSDLVVTNQNSNDVSILLGSGTGSFSAATNFAVGSSPRSLAIGDINGDGKSDLATPNFSTNNVSILLGSGTGSFSAATNFAVGSGPYSVALGDFNGDGRSDLAVANSNSANVSILLGSGTGSFSGATNFAVGAAPNSVAPGDFDANGKIDLATANFSGNNASILLNNSATCNAQASLNISGRIATANNSPLADAVVTLSGPITRVTQTNASGNYAFTNLAPGGNYAVTIQSAQYVFAPSRADFVNLSSNQTADFTAAPLAVPPTLPPPNDDFNSETRDTSKWNLGTQTQPPTAFDPLVNVAQINGQLRITPLSQVSGLHYNGYVSANSFDLRGGSVSVELVQAATGGADSIFAIGSDADNFYRFMVRTAGPGVIPLPTVRGSDGVERQLDTTVAQLIFQVNVGGQLTSLSIPYDPVQHRFMRFRHDAPANAIAFETSANNVDFTERHRVTLARSVSALTAELSAGTSNPTNPGATVFDNFGLVTSTFQFSSASYMVEEGGGSILITVTRAGSTAGTATVDYATSDGTARQSSDYILAAGRLTFVAGEASKTFRVLIVDNAQAEGNQNLNLLLQEPAASGLNTPGRAVLTIVDNDTTVATVNPLEGATFYVTQHYYDFLNREADAPGLAFWVDQITSCGSDTQCIEIRRINVSAAYFLSIEFQETGFLVHRFYNLALNRPNGLPRYLEFFRDTQAIGSGVVVGAPGWEALLEANRVAYGTEFAARAEYTALYPSTLTPAAYVDALYAHAGITPGAAERQATIDEFNTPTGARGRVLRRVAESPTLRTREFNRAFVLAQYFGYLRRNPDDAPDNNLNGFNFWLNKLNEFNGNFVNAEMVKAFITSGEYRHRFGP